MQLMVEEHGIQVEIMLAGAALRKVFSALVLLYTLAETEQRQRIYLIEEPDALLYPLLQTQFMAILIEVCNQYQIQLFVSSNSDAVRKFFAQVPCIFCT